MALPRGAGCLILADKYPAALTSIDPDVFKISREKNIRLYIEFAGRVPNEVNSDSIYEASTFDRAVITSKDVGNNGLHPMDILGLNDCYFTSVQTDSAILVLAKVVGFDKAELGLDNTPSHPILYHKDNMLIATTSLSSFETGRYVPKASWKHLWEYVIGWILREDKFSLGRWPSDVYTNLPVSDQITSQSRLQSIFKGVQWFNNGRFFVDSSWLPYWRSYQGDGNKPFGPMVPLGFKNGDGRLGILEGHASNINWDGSQQYRYVIRADVQGEAAFALAMAGRLFKDDDFKDKANNLVKFLFQTSKFRQGPRNHPDSASFGLLGWFDTKPGTYYGDDNARAVLGVIGASAALGSNKWNIPIVENLIGNFRTTGVEGFRGDMLTETELEKRGWRYYKDRHLVNAHPHFESWLWACYLWLYKQTGYRPLLEKTKNAIRLTMESYPDKWGWTNGLQQERARMILPLAWLVRVEDTPEHRKWLDIMVQAILINQDTCGAIREELGKGGGTFGLPKSNDDYGTTEASLIFQNGDKVADMLYTNNFAFFALNEAAHATKDASYFRAVVKLSDFLTKIQVSSNVHKDLDGAWFRAFDYGRWDYWASNADAGWGAWATLTGWIQSWIVATQVLVYEKNSYWDMTKDQNRGFRASAFQVIDKMLGAK